MFNFQANHRAGFLLSVPGEHVSHTPASQQNYGCGGQKQGADLLGSLLPAPAHLYPCVRMWVDL